MSAVDWVALPLLPDAEMTVLIYAPAENDPISLGWYDDDEQEWHDVVSGGTVEGVTHWALLPDGPTT